MVSSIKTDYYIRFKEGTEVCIKKVHKMEADFGSQFIMFFGEDGKLKSLVAANCILWMNACKSETP